MAQDDKYGLEPADDKYGLQAAGTATATAEPPSDEEIEAAYGKDVSPKIRAAVKSGVAPMKPPTKFETERPPIPENYGFTPGNVLKNAIGGAADLVKSGAEGAYDVAFGQGKDEEGNIKHGIGGLVGINDKGEFAPGERINALTQKYITDPAVAEWNKGNEVGGAAGVGHKAAATIPLIGPWAASLGEQAGTGDVGGAAGQVGGQVGLGEIIHHAPALADKVVRGTPLTEAGKIEAAQKQALTVKKPTMTETEYAQKVNDAMPDLQKVAQDNAGKIKTPRDAVGAINRRVQEMEAPIANHLRGLNAPEDMVHADQYRDQVDAAIDAEMAKHPGQLTPEEIEKAKGQVDKFIGDQPKTLEEVEGNRKRLNQDAEDYYSSRPADKRVMDSSDATAIAQRAAANAMRSILYGDDANPGLLEKAGVTAVDQAGNKVPLREFRRKVGNLLEVRDHFEDAMVRAEETGDWKPFQKIFSGPSMAAGGLGAIGGLVAGGPLGALFGTLAGEGAKAWGDYLRSKNPNLNVQKMFRNLEQTSAPNTMEARARQPLHDYQFAAGPQTSDFAEPLGPVRPPGNFAMEDLAPNRSGLWQTQVSEPPALETGAPTPGRHIAPIGPQEAPRQPLAPITGEQLPMNLPGPQHELFNLPQTPKVGEPRTMPEGIAGLLPEPRATELPPPGTAELAHPEMFPQPSGTGVPERSVERMPSGRMARIYKGTPEPRVVGQTAEGGPIREGQAPERPEVGGKGREGTLQPIQTTPAEKLTIGDTFVDEKGDPRRITAIEDDGTIKTADHTLRDYKEGEIKHLGEINSPKAQLARGGMFHAPVEEAEGRHDLGEIGEGLINPPETSASSASPTRPPSPRWSGDRGAMPGEASLFLDVPKGGDFEDAKAAIIEREEPRTPGRSRYELVDANGKTLGLYGTADDAAKAAEKHFPTEEGKVKPMTPPGRVFRAQNVGETKMNPETHAHATASEEEARKYAEGRGEIEGKPQEVRSVDLSKLKPEDYTTFKGPNGNDWVKFNRQLEPHEFEPTEAEGAKKKH